MSKIYAEFHFKAEKKIKCTNEYSGACLECPYSDPCQGFPHTSKFSKKIEEETK
jgi:hypothetical protein